MGKIFAQLKIIQSHQVACPGERVTFEVSGDINAKAYLWEWGDGKMGAGDPSFHEYQEGGTYPIRLTVQYSDNKPTEKLSTSILIHPRPQGKIVSSKSNDQICPGENITLTADPGFYDYKWSNGTSGQITSVSQPGLYTVTFRDFTTNCLGSAQKRIFSPPLPKLIISGLTSPCMGSTISYSVESLPGVSYIWTASYGGNIVSGQNTPNIQVLWWRKGLGTLSVKAINQNNCFRDTTIDIVVGEQLTFKIEGEPTFCRGKYTTLTIPIEFAKVTWSNGETGPSLIVNKPGIYRATVIHPEGDCKGEAAIEVREIETFRPMIQPAGILPLCPDDSILLTAENNFFSYEWNTGERKNSIVVNKPGKYIVTAQDSEGCLGSDTVEVVERKIFLSGTKEIIFPKREFSTVRVPFRNASKEVISVSAQNLPDAPFDGKFIPELPYDLPPGDTIWLETSFVPKDTIEFRDSIFINLTSNSCTQVQKIPLSGVGPVNIAKNSARVWIPDTSAYIGDKISIPVYAALVGEFTKQNFSFSAKIKFDRRAIHITSGNGVTLQNPLSDSVQYVNISVAGIELDNVPRVIARLDALALLSAEKFSPLNLENVNWENTVSQSEEFDGSVTVLDICFPQLIRSFAPTNIVVSPNPAGEKFSVNITSEEKGKFSLELLTAEGKREILSEWESDSKEEKNFSFESGKFSSGIYYLILRSPWGVVSKPVIIAR